MILSQFEMVCDRSWMVPVSVSGVQAGMALGSFGGLLGDRYFNAFCEVGNDGYH